MTNTTSGVVRWIPSDDKLLIAIAKVALSHTHLENELKMWVKTLANMSPSEARLATQTMDGQQLKKVVRRLLKRTVSDDVVLLKVDALLQRARQLSDERNVLLHSYWGRNKERDEEYWLVMRGEMAQEAPSAAQIEGVWEEIENLWKELIDARMNGFIREALNKKSPLGSDHDD